MEKTCPSGVVLEAHDVTRNARKAIKADCSGATSNPHHKKRNETGGKAKAKLKGDYKYLMRLL